MKIDLVYTWYDDSDKKTEKLRLDLLREHIKKRLLQPASVHKSRWRDNNELKHSLRSVEKNAPWINHIYIVTNGQKPSWLNLNHPKITIVPHSKIMPKSALPTFNSLAIEACLDNIPGLSEYFIYGNDDFFFGPCNPSDFFTSDGMPINYAAQYNDAVRYDKFSDNGTEFYFADKCYNDPFLEQTHRVRKLIADITGKKYDVVMSHNLEPLRKSWFTEVKKIFPKEFENTIKSKFRHPTNMLWFIHILYNNAMGRSKLYLNYGYRCGNKIIKQDVNRKPISKKWLRFKKHFLGYKKVFFTLANEFDICDKVLRYNPQRFCINDGDLWTLEQINRHKAFMKFLFPEKSCFEK